MASPTLSLAFWLSLISQQPQSPCRVNPAAKEHVRQAINSLPPDSGFRRELEAGACGGGVHYVWMDKMRRQGVKRASIEVQFVPSFWRARPTQMRIVRTLYFSKYDHDCAQITDPERLRQIRASGLEQELGAAALRDTEKDGWWFEAPPRALRRYGVSYVNLVDDEWLPVSPPNLQPLDPKRSPLVQAALLGDEIVVADLLKRGVSPEDRDDAFMGATLGLDSCVTKLLLGAGANVNMRSHRGNTPLINAVWQAGQPNVRLLLDAGADVSARNDQNETALSIATRMGYIQIIELLKQAGATQ